MTSKNASVMTYDYDNRLSSSTTGSVTTSYVYDFQGARVKKITDTPESITTYIGKLFHCKWGRAKLSSAKGLYFF
jgi:hypothetical protein